MGKAGVGILVGVWIATFPALLTAEEVFVLGVFHPSGIGTNRFTSADGDLLSDLGINLIEKTRRWGERVATVQDHEEQLMGFCSNRTEGAIRMLVEFEPESGVWKRHLRSYLDHPDTDMDFLRADVQALTSKWPPGSGFYGYLIGHEEDPLYPEALRRVLDEVAAQDPDHTMVFVDDALHGLPDREAFFQVFFAGLDDRNRVFQHEHYVFHTGRRGTKPNEETRRWREAIAYLLESYDYIAAQARSSAGGPWHAILQTFEVSGVRGIRPRWVSREELRLQAFLALSRGAKGIIYFVYSSGPDQGVYYSGLVSEHDPTTGERTRRQPYFDYVKGLNDTLKVLGDILIKLRWNQAFSESHLDGYLKEVCGGEWMEFGLFDPYLGSDYFIVVNKHCAPGYDQTLDITLDASRLAHPDAIAYRLTDVYGDRTEANSHAGTVTFEGLSIPRGEGRLFRVDHLTQPVVPPKERAPRIQKSQLYQNRPNPFHTDTVIPFTLAFRSPIQLEIFNLAGQRVAAFGKCCERRGTHAIPWVGTDIEGTQLASGIYVYRVRTPHFTAARRMTLIR